MISLFQYWHKSLGLLQPATFKLVGLVTLKRAKETYFLMGKYFGWLILLIFYCIWCTPLGYQYFSFTVYGLLIWTFFAIVACRPSLEIKDGTYFSSKALLLLVYMIIIGLVSVPCAFLYVALRNENIFLERFFEMFAFFLIHVTLFFILDSALYMHESGIIFALKAFKRSFLMLFFNMPIFLIIGTLFSLILSVLVLDWYVCIILLLFSMPLLFSFLMQLYTKWVYEQNQLYFGELQWK